MNKESRWKGRNQSGFTIVELMITVIIVAILAALAYPSYAQYVRKAKRGEAQELLLNWSVNQEIFRTNNPTYADTDDIEPPTLESYTFDTVGTPDAATYQLEAQASGDQLADKEDGQSCGTLTINQNGAKGPIVCWGGKS